MVNAAGFGVGVSFVPSTCAATRSGRPQTFEFHTVCDVDRRLAVDARAQNVVELHDLSALRLRARALGLDDVPAEREARYDSHLPHRGDAVGATPPCESASIDRQATGRAYTDRSHAPRKKTAAISRAARDRSPDAVVPSPSGVPARAGGAAAKLDASPAPPATANCRRVVVVSARAVPQSIAKLRIRLMVLVYPVVSLQGVMVRDALQPRKKL